MTRRKPEHGLRVELLSLGSGDFTLEEVMSLQVRLDDGSWLGIHPGHAPLIATTSDGQLKALIGGEVQTYPVKAGILTLKSNVVSILTTH